LICGVEDRDRVLPNGSSLICKDEVYFDNLLQYFMKLVGKARMIIFLFRSEQKKTAPGGGQSKQLSRFRCMVRNVFHHRMIRIRLVIQDVINRLLCLGSGENQNFGIILKGSYPAFDVSGVVLNGFLFNACDTAEECSA
jgi:hypothetical protein